MEQLTEDRNARHATGIWILFLGSLALIPLWLAIGWFDDATELTPTHEGIAEACMGIAFLCSLIACGAAVYLTRTLAPRQRVILPLVIMFEFALGVFMVATHASAILEGWADFPAGKTLTWNTLVPISRAYQVQGKGTHQHIQTMPIWSDLDITKADYSFMQEHRAPGDEKRDPDEIWSRGYFCANVTLQQSGEALRILHAGSHVLPEGTVIICPASTHRW